MDREARPRIVKRYKRRDGKVPVDEWLTFLRDSKGKKAIFDRFQRVELGTLGHCDDIGDGVWGFKINVGPGYRVYFGQDGPVIVVLLCGGEKHGQDRDIVIAKTYWRDYKVRKSGEAINENKK